MSGHGEAKPQLLYAQEEAAAALRIGRTYLYQLKSANQITYIKIGRSVRYREEDLLDFINQRRIVPSQYE